jgi:serpin B
MNNENEEKKQIKISLGMAISLIILLVVIITIIIGVAVVNKKETTNSSGSSTNEVIVEPKEENNGDLNDEIAKSDFSIRFLKLENNKKNMIYSPLSIKYALNMLKEGANGNTKTQIENVIGKQNLTNYNNIDKVLSLANGVYIRDTYAKDVKENYKKILTERYNAEINYDSFSNANNINGWIEYKTLGIIKNMLRDETVQNPDNIMLLINALAIDMKWKNQFDPKDTGSSDFYLEDGSKMSATTMHLEDASENISYYKDTNITALTMNLEEYEGTQLEFVAIMPEKNLSEYIETFTMDEFNNIVKKSKLASKTKNGVDISIPRFSFDYDLQLKKDLKKLGITDAFDSNLADFSKISDEEIYVSDALHKANIDFTEKGVKAAAVTVIYMTCGVALEEDKPVEINIDKPFLYIIRDKNTGEVWFVGTVYEPNSWEEDKLNYEYR